MGRDRKPHLGTSAAVDTVQRLFNDLDDLGRWAKGEAHSGLGKVGTWYLTDMMSKEHSGGRMPLEGFLGLLLGSPMTPGRFVARCFDENDPIYRVIADARKLVDELPRIPVPIRDAPVLGRSRVRRGGTDEEIDRIDTARYINPKRALQLAASGMREARGPHATARLLGGWASAQRMLYRLDLASVAVGRALALAELSELDGVVAELAQRASMIMRDRGNLDLSLELAMRAGATYLKIGEWEHLGRALVDGGMACCSMGRHDDAERLCSAALGLVSSARNRFSAFQQIALARAASHAFKAADEAAQRAEACAPDEAYVTARLAWLRGELAMQQSAWPEADRFLSEALSKLRGAAYDAVLVAAQLLRAKMRAGREREAADLARSLEWFEGALLQDPLDVNRLLHAALLDLVKAGEEARITEDFLKQTVARIESARSARVERLRRRLRP